MQMNTKFTKVTCLGITSFSEQALKN